MSNRLRGEVAFAIEGEPHRLCLTLGALAEIEAGLGLSSLMELEARLKAPTIADIACVLAALLRGGGHDMADETLLARQVDLPAAARAIAAAFGAAGLGAK
jgi:Phage tail tube protein, GTA-gp10